MAQADLKDFLKTPVKGFLFLWFPVLFSMIAEPLTGLVDTAFVAQLGSESLAALGIGTVVVTGALGLFNFLSVGSQTEISQASGRGDLKEGRLMASQALTIGALIGSALLLLALSFAPSLASLMGGTNSVQEHAAIYIQIRAFAAPAVLLTMTSFGILYGLANMKAPLYIALTVNILNLILDPLLIFGYGPFPELGIAGAALASSISQWIGAGLCGYKILQTLGFTPGFRKKDIIKLVGIAKNLLLRSLSLILFLLLSTRIANQYGTESGAAHQAIRQVWIFSALFLDAAAVTAQSLIGFYYGTADILRSRQVARLVCLGSLGLGIILMLTMILGTNIFARILVPHDAYSIFYPAWIVSAIVQPIAAIAYVTDGIHWGTGDFKYLKNAVIFATLCGIGALGMVSSLGIGNLTTIWYFMALWITIRAIFGFLRIWPGIGHSPLALKSSQ